MIVGESSKAVELSNRLFDNGIFVKPIVYPLVSKDTSRVRNIVTAQHTKEDLDFALETYEKIGKQMKLI